MRGDEVEHLRQILKTAWYRIWIEGTDRHCRADRRGIRTERVSATCDAKYLEVGISCKSDNVDVFS